MKTQLIVTTPLRVVAGKCCDMNDEAFEENLNDIKTILKDPLYMQLETEDNEIVFLPKDILLNSVITLKIHKETVREYHHAY